MSILKFANGKNRGNDALERGINYILNSHKTSPEYIACNGVEQNSAVEDMKTVQQLLGKDTGRRYIHYILSFDAGVSPQKALTIASESAEYFADDYQYILSIHNNTENVHAHVILNAVNVHTGKKFSQSKAEMLDFRDYVNTVLLAHSLNPVGRSGEDEEVYSGLYFEEEDTFYDFEDVDDCKENESFFGPIDPEETELMRLAEQYEADEKQIIRFFEGKDADIPSGWDYEDALMVYEQWCEHINYIERQADDSNDFFKKLSRCIDCETGG